MTTSAAADTSARMTAVRTVTPRISTAADMTRTYFALSDGARRMGLLERTRAFYAACGLGVAIAFIALTSWSVALGDSWWQLALAPMFGVVFTQVAFLAHEAAHGQIFASARRNEWLGRLLVNAVVGMSYSWWMDKHSRHHGRPNQVSKDPDVAVDVISFVEEDAAAARGVRRWITQRQGWLFFPLLTLEGINLHYLGLRYLLTAPNVRLRVTELALILFRFAALLVPLFLLLPWEKALAVWAVQLVVFGVYMGASFAPNHKGMPLLETNARVDFLSRQVLTSRNIRGGWWATALYGGLNYQIEHHLFPTMARPHLRATSALVKRVCAENALPYTEASAIESYGIIVRYLNRVGLSARDPFDCPARSALSVVDSER